MYHIEFTPELIAHLEAMEDDTIDCTAGSLEILDMSRNSHRLIKGLIDNITKLEHENAVLTRALVDAAQDLNDCRHVPQCVTQNELLCGNDLCLEILKADAHAELAKEAKDE